MTVTASREVHLVSRPETSASVENFAVVEAPVPELRDGDVLVKNTFISVDPYMRNRMNDVKSYVPPFKIGEPMSGGAVGVVVESRSPHLPVGTNVRSRAARL